MPGDARNTHFGIVFRLDRDNWPIAAPALLGMAAMILWLVVAAARLTYPYELEWMEGAVVDHVCRLLRGEPLYVAPSVDFIPQIYTPLYFYLTALLSLITGPGFLPARMLGITGTLVTLVGMILLVRRETGSVLWGLTAAGILAAAYETTGCWYDIARVDMVFLAFVVWALLVARTYDGTRAGVLTGLLFGMAFLAKQSAVVVAFPIGVYLALFDRRALVAMVLSSGVIAGGTTLLLDWLHDGWFTYWILHIPGQHLMHQSVYTTFWTLDLFPSLPVALGLAVAFFSFQFRVGFNRTGVFWLLASLGLMGASLMSRLHTGGWINVLIPAVMSLALLSGLGGAVLFHQFWNGKSLLSRLAGWMLILLVGLQFATLAYNPLNQLPTQEDREAGDRLIHSVAAVEGEVLLPFHGWYATMAGKNPAFHQMALNDLRKGDVLTYRVLDGALRKALTSGDCAAVVTDRPWFDAILNDYYRPDSISYPTDNTFVPVTGYRVRPEVIWRRK